MEGTNPDGSHYNDVGVPWVNYFSGGDAIHGFVRPGYGWPQSLGCVEVPSRRRRSRSSRTSTSARSSPSSRSSEEGGGEGGTPGEPA